MTNKKHGGAGRGQGRKPKYSKPMRGKTILLTESQRETLKRIGGDQVLRDWLDCMALNQKETNPEWKRDQFGLYIDTE